MNKFKIINRDMIKFIAVFLMFWGHLIAWITLLNNSDNSNAIYNLPLWANIIINLSMFCPPVMFFSVADGYKYTRNRKKYALRLFIFACITQPFDYLLFHDLQSTNIIFTLFFGLLAIMAWESHFRLWKRVFMIIFCIIATIILYTDWLILGILHIISLHIFREKPKKRFIAYTLLMLVSVILQLINLGTVPTVPLLVGAITSAFAMMTAYFFMITLYNGKKGKYSIFAKWFFYCFYPVHYLIIWIVYNIQK